jgi:serine protease Do
MSRRSISRFFTYASALSGIATAIASSPAELKAQETSPPTASEAIAQEVRGIFERCRNAVVKIQAVDRHGELFGSGFFVDPNGTLYTSYTVGGESREIVVVHGTRKYPARRIIADPRSGIAILKVDLDGQTPFLLPCRSKNLQVASPVVTIGYPMDLPSTPSFGTIGGFDLKYLGRFFATTHIRANVPVQRGEGGAPLLNMRGEVIGVLISSLDSGSASFVLPIAAAEKVHKDFVRFGEIHPGWMGVNVAAMKEAINGSHAQVDEIMEGGPAEKAGLQKGDVLLQIGERKIQAVEDVLDASFFMTADDELTVKVCRENQELSMRLSPTEHPTATAASRQGVHTRMQSLVPNDLRRDPLAEPNQ